MKKVLIEENERGFLFINGKFERMLGPGKHVFLRSGCRVEVVDAAGHFYLGGYDVKIFAADAMFQRETVGVDVADQGLALHYINGKYEECLEPGDYTFWNIFEKHEFRQVAIDSTEVGEDVPRYLFSQMPVHLYKKVVVEPWEKALLFLDQSLYRVLSEGTYYFWKNGHTIDIETVDTRLLQMDVAGQEILSLDKVALRINFVFHYRIADPVKAKLEIQDLEGQLYILVQLALREYVGKYRLDDILENKDQLSDFVLQRIRERQNEYFVDFYDAGVKDVVLPGEIRNIMNTVLMAEKQAQANVIMRREEVASTRSLLNTAKLMDENHTLYKLKELEYLEKICENVGNITVSGGSDLLSQLTAVLKGA